MATMNVFDMLRYGSPVWSDEDRGAIVTWNGSATYNLWTTSDSAFYNVDCFSNDTATTLDEAKVVAEEHMHAEGEDA